MTNAPAASNASFFFGGGGGGGRVIGCFKTASADFRLRLKSGRNVLARESSVLQEDH